MLIIIMLSILCVIGILGIIGSINCWFDFDYIDDMEFWSIMLSIISGIALIVCIINIIVIQIPAKKDYEKVVMEKEMLEYRLENDNLGIGNELLYKDIVEFNQELKDVKYYANNPWTNWFVNGYIAEIDYIELEGK